MACRPLLIAVLCILASCGNKSDPGSAAKASPQPTPTPTAAPTAAPTPTPAQPTDEEIMAESIAAMTAAADRMCACVDMACADAVAADVAKYFAEMGKKYANRTEPDPKPNDAAKLNAVGERYGECAAKLKIKAEK